MVADEVFSKRTATLSRELCLSAKIPGRAAKVTSRYSPFPGMSPTRDHVMGRYRNSALILVVLWLAGGKASATDDPVAIPASPAAHAFSEVDELCSADAGELWGKSLCGPMMFVDDASRTAVLNESAPGSRQDGDIRRITLPKSVPLANTAVNYGGKRWSMILWPLLEDKTEREILLMHESFHRIQPALGLEGASSLTANGHLDTKAGRIWLRAEMHALRDALRSAGDQRKSALVDALLLRTYRRSLWPQAAEQERNLELTEGLAEATGIRLAVDGRDARIRAALDNLRSAEAQESFVRSFAYAIGPAYAQLLDAADPGWRDHVTSTFDFGLAAANAYGIAKQLVDKCAAEQALTRHDGDEIVAQETQRATRTQKRLADYENRFIDGPTVTFPLKNPSNTFDPRRVMHFVGHGSVYQVIRIRDVWGVIDVEDGGALVSPNFDRITVPLGQDQTGRQLGGDGWSATLEDPFVLVPDPQKPGSFVVAGKDR